MEPRSYVLGLLLSIGALACARADDPARGVWERDTGTARVQIAPCGDKLCGTIVWVRDKESPTKVGMRVFYDGERERPNVWTGRAFNPEDKQTYVGTVAITGDKMTSTGCVLARLICANMYCKRLR